VHLNIHRCSKSDVGAHVTQKQSTCPLIVSIMPGPCTCKDTTHHLQTHPGVPVTPNQPQYDAGSHIRFPHGCVCGPKRMRCSTQPAMYSSTGSKGGGSTMHPAACQVRTSCCGTSTGQKQPATHSSPRASSISYCTHLQTSAQKGCRARPEHNKQDTPCANLHPLHPAVTLKQTNRPSRKVQGQHMLF
jgi:hypothetical protein